MPGLCRRDFGRLAGSLFALVALAGQGAQASSYTSLLPADDWRESNASAGTYRLYEDLVTSVSAVSWPEGRRPASPNERRFVSTTETLVGPIATQPRGPLTGKIIFASGGHGWTNDNTSTTLWYTQRPELFNVMEDYGNLDQMNLFADECFRAGATVVPARPMGYQRVERVLDDSNRFHVKFQGQWRDSESTVSFRLPGGLGGYKYTTATLQESAVVRYNPVIPASDFYPVYCWARHGADRVPQTYRIVHSGGATEVVVDHRRVGSGWVYLGEYHFERGEDGYVEIVNRVANASDADGNHVIIADAIRFGNGMGDVNRGGGISGRPREEEGARYWLERSVQPELSALYDTGDSDQSANVGAPPRMAAFMNRETEGTAADRLFLSFHSNGRPIASKPERGVLGLINRTADAQPIHQREWAETLAREINDTMSQPGLKLPAPWHVRKDLTVSFINYGEIRRDAINNEMAATIGEVAFHDDAQDAAILATLTGRRALARASLRAALKFLASIAPADRRPVIELPPSAPELLSAEWDAAGGAVVVQFAPAADAPKGVRYLLETSRNGKGFDAGREVQGPSVRLTDVSTTTPVYFRLVAESAGGQSVPSQVLGLSHRHRGTTATPPVLLVAAFDSTEPDQAPLQYDAGPFNSPQGSGGTFLRVVPRLLNAGDQAAEWGELLAGRGANFESVSRRGFERMTEEKVKSYSAVVFAGGRQSGRSELFGPAVTQRLKAAHNAGRGVVLTGASIARTHSGGTLPTEFGARFVKTTTATAAITTNVATAEGPIAARVSRGLGVGYHPIEVDVLEPTPGATVQYAWADDERGAAGIFQPAAKGAGASFVLAAPIEHLGPSAARRQVLDAVLSAIGLPKPGKP